MNVLRCLNLEVVNICYYIVWRQTFGISWIGTAGKPVNLNPIVPFHYTVPLSCLPRKFSTGYRKVLREMTGWYDIEKIYTDATVISLVTSAEVFRQMVNKATCQ